MSDLASDVAAAVAAVNQVQTDVTDQAPSVADQVLAAVTPVLEAAGWTAPAPEAELPSDTDSTTGDSEEATS